MLHLGPHNNLHHFVCLSALESGQLDYARRLVKSLAFRATCLRTCFVGAQMVETGFCAVRGDSKVDARSPIIYFAYSAISTVT